VPLISVGVKGKVRDYLCEVQVNHRYIHKGTEPIETTFKFPLDLFGALIGFSVTVDGKTVEAKITPRAKITEISSPREAPIVDEEEQPEFFECSISGVQPNKEVELELRYATELVVEHGASLRFVLPSSVISPGSEENAEGEEKTEQTRHQLSIELDVELPEDFSVETPAHKDVVIKQEQKRPHTSVITLNKESAHNEPSFVLLVNMKGSLQPWAAVSQHPAGGKAALLSFFPQFDIKRAGPSEILFIVDRSSTISPDDLQNVKEALQLFLRSLSSGVHFNIIAFGATFTKMSPSTVEYNQETLDMANQFVQKIHSEQGTANLMAPLRDVFSTAFIKDAPRQLFVITDGHVSNTQGIFSLIRKNASKTRVFSFGVGNRVGHHLITEMARAGYGEFEFVSDSEQLKDVFVRQLKRALQPALVEPHIDWGTLKVTQAPETLRAVFNGDRLFVYALLPSEVPSDATATFRAVMHDGRHVTFEAKLGTASSGSNLINILAARNRIRDLEEVEEDKSREEITQLGMTYGLASKFTSFIAVVREQPVALHSSTSVPMDTLNESLTTSPKKKDDTSSNNTSGSNTPLNANSAAFVPRSSAVTIASPNKKTYTADFMQSLSKYYTDIPTHVNPELRSLDIFSAFGSADNKNKQSIGQTVSTTKSRDSKPGHKRDTSTGGRSDLKKSGKSSLTASRENIALPPVAPLVASDNRWIRPDAIDAEVLSTDQLKRKALGILNRMTLEMFVPLSEQLYDLGFSTVQNVDALIEILFEKAMVEPHFSTMYATLCSMLAEKIKPFVEDEKTKDFKRSLILNCQTEFQNRKEKAKIDPALVGEEKEDAERLSKLKYLGTMKFIGELFKQGLLAEKTMHTCISIMLEEISTGVDSSEDQFEGLVKFITTTGQLLESPQMKQPELVKNYFEQLQKFSNMEFPSRVRFMLKDIIDLRDNGWTPRRKGVEAKTLAEARADVEDNSSATPARNTSKTQPNTPASPAPASGKKQKEHRDKLIKSTSAIPRSVSHTQDDEWETAGSSRKSRGGSKRDLHSSQNSWETVGGGRGGKGGRGRGGSKSNSRVSHREETTKEEKKTLSSVRTNLFAALRDDDEEVQSPKVKARALAQSDFPVSRNEEPEERRTVTFEKPSRDINDKMKVIYEEYLVSNDHEEALECVRELNLTEKETSVAVVQIYRVALEGRDKDRDLLHKLLLSLLSSDQLTEDDLIEGFSSIATTIDDDDMDYPMASRYLGTFIGNMVANDKLSLAFLKSALSPIVETGKAIRVALVCLQAIQKDKGEEHCESLLNKSGLDLKRLVRKVDREGDLLSQLLSKEGLSNLSKTGSDVTTTEDNVEESRPRRQSVSSSVIDSIILQQSAEGYWNLDQRFADLLTARLGDLEPAIPESIKDRTSLWATLLALAFLEGNYGSKREKWGLVSKKAREWVDREVTEGRGQLQEDARSCLNDLDLFIA